MGVPAPDGRVPGSPRKGWPHVSLGQSGAGTMLIWPAELAEALDRPSHFSVKSNGRWLVHTSTSAYLVDLAGPVVARFPGTGGSEDFDVAILRRDRLDIPLQAVVAAVGRPMHLQLDLRGDGVVTLRRTTPVVRIERAPGPPANLAVLPTSGGTGR